MLILCIDSNTIITHSNSGDIKVNNILVTNNIASNGMGFFFIARIKIRLSFFRSLSSIVTKNHNTKHIKHNVKGIIYIILNYIS